MYIICKYSLDYIYYIYSLINPGTWNIKKYHLCYLWKEEPAYLKLLLILISSSLPTLILSSPEPHPVSTFSNLLLAPIGLSQRISYSPANKFLIRCLSILATPILYRIICFSVEIFIDLFPLYRIICFNVEIFRNLFPLYRICLNVEIFRNQFPLHRIWWFDIISYTLHISGPSCASFLQPLGCKNSNFFFDILFHLHSWSNPCFLNCQLNSSTPPPHPSPPSSPMVRIMVRTKLWLE